MSSSQRMATYLPGYYRHSGLMQGVLTGQGAGVDDYAAAMADVVSQAFVSTATWGLDLWESELGIKTDYRLSTEERRSTIMAKLRGVGTVTVALVRAVAESYAQGDVAVIDSMQGLPAYTVVIQFINRFGLPAAMQALKQALREIIPAHLDIEYEVTYLYWDVLDAQTLTWDQKDALGLAWDVFETGEWLN